MDDERRSCLVNMGLRSLGWIEDLSDRLFCFWICCSVKLVLLNKGLDRRLLCCFVFRLQKFSDSRFRLNQLLQTFRLNDMNRSLCLVLNRFRSIGLEKIKDLIIVRMKQSSIILMIEDTLSFFSRLWLGKSLDCLWHCWNVRFWIADSKSRLSLYLCSIRLQRLKMIRVHIYLVPIVKELWSRGRQRSASRSLMDGLSSDWDLYLFVLLLQTCFLFKRDEFFMTSE